MKLQSVYVQSGIGSFLEIFLFIVMRILINIEVIELSLILIGSILHISPYFLESFIIKRKEFSLRKFKDACSLLGLLIGLGLLLFLLYTFTQIITQNLIDIISLFWFPATLFIGFLGLFRFFLSKQDKEIPPSVSKWFRIEGSITAIYSLCLIIFSVFFWNYQFLSILTLVALIPGGISTILFGASEENYKANRKKILK